MPKKVAIKKECPGCERQLPVACKTCPCGHSFRKPVSEMYTMSSDSPVAGAAAAAAGSQVVTASADTGTPGIRRTERVKREKPKFYDASQYERAPRKRKPRVDVEGKQRGRPEKQRQKEQEREEQAADDQESVCEDIMADATKDELSKYAIILSEINRKLCVVNPKF